MLAGTFQKVSSIRRIELAQVQEHEDVSDLEIRIPARLSTSPRAEPYIGLQQRWQRRIEHALRHGVDVAAGRRVRQHLVRVGEQLRVEGEAERLLRGDDVEG